MVLRFGPSGGYALGFGGLAFGASGGTPTPTLPTPLEEWLFAGNLNATNNAANNGTGSGHSFGTRSTSPVSIATGSPQIAIGTYVGDGTNNRQVNCGFKPDFVIIRGATTQVLWWHRWLWHGRTDSFHNAESVQNRIAGTYASGFLVSTPGGSTAANGNGVTFQYIAIRDNNSGSLATSSWIGNATDPRIIEFMRTQPDLVMVKRDSTLPSQWRTRLMTSAASAALGGSSQSIKSLDAKGVTIDASNSTNQNVGSASLGEGIEAVGFKTGPNIDLVEWVGTGNAGDLVPTLFEPDAIIVLREDGLTNAFCLLTDAMTGVGVFETGALQTNRLTLESGGIRIGSTTTYNTAGVAYTALVMRRAAPTAQPDRAITKTDYVELSGSGSYIECGSDASLALSGAMSLEWWGVPTFTPGTDIANLMMRGAGRGVGTNALDAGTFAWGLFAYPPTNGGALGWEGNVLRIVHTDYLAQTLTESNTNRYSWNTGLRINSGEEIHILVTHDGSGHWQVYINGLKVKDRRINMVTAEGGRRNGGAPGSTLPTVFGARRNESAAIVESTAQRIYGARTYASELTAGDAFNLYCAATGTPVTSAA